jgi:hypothetical protein
VTFTLTETLFIPRNRLAKMLTAAERRAFQEHVARAQAALDARKADVRERLKIDVAALLRMCAAPEEEVFAESAAIGWAASAVLEGAAAVGEAEIAEAAAGVWDIVEALRTRGVWHTEALQVQVQALRLLSSGRALSAGERAAVADRLTRMRGVIGAAA